MNYKEEITLAMAMLARHPKTLFVGQSVVYGGQAMFPTIVDVPKDMRIELPVVEEFQMGFCTGLALQGFIPICMFPRWDFVLLAANQLVNHLDKIPVMGDFRPKVIIRTAVGPMEPLNAGPQHTQDHTEAFKLMLKTIPVIELLKAEDVFDAYEAALERQGSTLLVEHMRLYRE